MCTPHATLQDCSWSCARTSARAAALRRGGGTVQRPPSEDADIVAARPRYREQKTHIRDEFPRAAAERHPDCPKMRQKRAAVAGGSKVKQGGVKQSGQEPLDVQKMDNHSNEGESLITR